ARAAIRGGVSTTSLRSPSAPRVAARPASSREPASRVRGISAACGPELAFGAADRTLQRTTLNATEPVATINAAATVRLRFTDLPLQVLPRHLPAVVLRQRLAPFEPARVLVRREL